MKQIYNYYKSDNRQYDLTVCHEVSEVNKDQEHEGIQGISNSMRAHEKLLKTCQ